MSIESELTIGEHCDSLRQQVDIARETAIENIHTASNTLMVAVDAYERECLSSSRATKEFTEVTLEDVSKRLRVFLAEQQEHLQSVKASDEESTMRLDEAKKLAQELSDRKKQLKAAMFNNKLAAFHTLPSVDEASLLGDLAFTHMQLPFAKLASDELKPVDIRSNCHFALPLDRGQRIVIFDQYYESFDFTQMSSFDRLGRLLGKCTLRRHVDREQVAQCGPRQFIVYHFTDSSEFSVFDSDLKRLRNVSCKKGFGLAWENNGAQQEQYTRMIQAYHLDTLSEAFPLRVPAKYRIERILADERHVVAMICLSSEPLLQESRHWFMSIFDLQAIGNESGDVKTERSLPLLEVWSIDLTIDSVFLHSAFLFDDWIVVSIKNRNELVWFDKSGRRSETSTKLSNINGNMRDIHSSGSSLLFAVDKDKLLLKP